MHLHVLRSVCRDAVEMQPTFKIKMSQDGNQCTLHVSGITQKMAGEYKCVAVNSVGEASCIAKINVVGELTQTQLSIFTLQLIIVTVFKLYEFTVIARR